MENGYNGYSNYETWNIMLWINNDEWMQREFSQRVGRLHRQDRLTVETLKEAVGMIFWNGDLTIHDDPATPDGVFITDKRIDWDELLDLALSDLTYNRTGK